MIHSLNKEQAGAELYQAQFKLGQALPNKDLSYVIIKKNSMTKVCFDVQQSVLKFWISAFSKILQLSLSQLP